MDIRNEARKTQDGYRVGECTRCGACCNLNEIINDPEIMLYIDAGILKQVNQKLVDGKTGKCKHLKHIDGKAYCEIYEKRPDFCKIFPATPRDLLTVPQCGYRFYDGRGRRVWV